MESKLATTIIADVSDSTPFYEFMGDDQAQKLIQHEINRLREVLHAHGGIPVGQKGDDVLCYFDDPNAAIQAALEMVRKPPGSLLSIHAGVHHGPIVVAENGIFGETVNLTARLATAANPGEACVSDDVVARLRPELKTLLRPIGQLRLKGVSDPVLVSSLEAATEDLSTVMHVPMGGGGTQAEGFSLVLSQDDQTWRCREGDTLNIGRSAQSDVVLPQPWVSRTHAVLSLKDGKLMLTDRSSSGTYVRFEEGREVILKRETIMLSGNGLISPALPIQHADARPLEFEILRR